MAKDFEYKVTNITSSDLARGGSWAVIYGHGGLSLLGTVVGETRAASWEKVNLDPFNIDPVTGERTPSGGPFINKFDPTKHPQNPHEILTQAGRGAFVNRFRVGNQKSGDVFSPAWKTQAEKIFNPKYNPNPIGAGQMQKAHKAALAGGHIANIRRGHEAIGDNVLRENLGKNIFTDRVAGSTHALPVDAAPSVKEVAPSLPNPPRRNRYKGPGFNKNYTGPYYSPGGFKGNSSTGTPYLGPGYGPSTKGTLREYFGPGYGTSYSGPYYSPGGLGGNPNTGSYFMPGGGPSNKGPSYFEPGGSPSNLGPSYFMPGGSPGNRNNSAYFSSLASANSYGNPSKYQHPSGIMSSGIMGQNPAKQAVGLAQWFTPAGAPISNTYLNPGGPPTSNNYLNPGGAPGNKGLTYLGPGGSPSGVNQLVANLQKLASTNVSSSTASTVSTLVQAITGGGSGGKGGGGGGGFGSWLTSSGSKVRDFFIDPKQNARKYSKALQADSGGVFGQIGTQFRHAAIWQAYTPLIMGVGGLVGKAFGMGDYISKPQFALTGISMNEAQRRNTAEWALGQQKPFTTPGQHLTTFKEVASALGVNVTDKNLPKIQRAAALTDVMAQYAMTDPEMVSRYAGRFTNIAASTDKFKGMPREDIYENVLSSHANIMKMGTAHYNEFYNAAKYALKPMMSKGRSFEEASAELSYHVELMGQSAGPIIQKQYGGTAAIGKQARLNLQGEYYEKMIAEKGLGTSALHKTIKDRPDKYFLKGQGRKELAGEIRRLTQQYQKGYRETIVERANTQRLLVGLRDSGFFKPGRGNPLDEASQMLYNVYGGIETSADVDAMYAEMTGKAKKEDLWKSNRENYTDQSFGGVSGRFSKGMEVYYDAMRNDIGRPVFRKLQKVSQDATSQAQLRHSYSTGNMDEVARIKAQMMDQAKRGESSKPTDNVLAGARSWDAKQANQGFFQNWMQHGESASWKTGLYTGAATAGIIGLAALGAAFFAPGAAVAGGISLAGALVGGAGVAGIGGTIATGAGTLASSVYNMYTANTPSIKNFEKIGENEILDYYKTDPKMWSKLQASKNLRDVDPRYKTDAFDTGWPQYIPEGPITPMDRKLPDDKDVGKYTKDIESGKLAPTVIVPAPIVNLTVVTDGKGGVQVHQSTTAPTTAPPNQPTPGYDPISPTVRKWGTDGPRSIGK